MIVHYRKITPTTLAQLSQEVFLLSEQPMTCPSCSSRTDFEDVIGTNQQVHVCLNTQCNRVFIAESDDED